MHIGSMRMPVVGLTLVMAAALSLSGCHTMPMAREVSSVPVSDVLNSVKDELTAYWATAPTVVPTTGVCYKAGPEKLNLVPIKATVNLKTVAARQSEPNIGLTAPIGVISLDPSYSGLYSQSQTQNLQIALDVPSMGNKATMPPGEHLIGKAIADLRDELLKVDHNITPCLKYGEKSVIKLTVAFDVVKKSAGGFSLKLVVFKIGDKETFTNQTSQTLDLEFALSGGQLMLMIN